LFRFEFAGILQRKFFNVCNFGEKLLIGEILTVIHVMLKPKLNGGLDWMDNHCAEEWAPNFKMRNIRRYKGTVFINIFGSYKFDSKIYVYTSNDVVFWLFLFRRRHCRGVASRL